MPRFLFILGLLMIGSNMLMAQAPGCPNVFGGNDTTINCAGTVQLNAFALHTGLTNTYTVSSIPYTPPYPFNTGTPILVNIDDRWSDVINLPFNFCFFGINYNQIVAGSNGCLSFSTANANQFCAWSFNVPVPNPNIINNSTGPFILGPFHDIHPGVGGSMYYALLGSYPCRTFVINYFQIPMFSCTSSLATHQIVIYETTNVIEVYIQSAPLCPAWNNGNKVIGIQNAAGNLGFSPPGRNTGPWQATNEAWRFTPNGTPNYAIQWYQGINPISPTSTAVVSPITTTTYSAICVYDQCDGSQVTVTDDVIVTVSNPMNLVVNPLIDEICAGESLTISATGADTYSWSPVTNLINVSDSVVIVSPPLSTTYTLLASTQQGTCTGTVGVFVYVNPAPPVDVFSFPQNVCDGDSALLFAMNADTFVWNDLTTENPRTVFPTSTTTYSVTGTNIYGCTNSASITVNVSEKPDINFSPPNPSICFGDEVSITVTGATAYLWSNGSITPTITVNPEISTTYTVTVAGDAGNCTSSAEVNVTVFPTPEPSFIGEPEEACAPMTTVFTAQSSHASQWLWNFGDGGTSSQQNPTYKFTTPGNYNVSLTVVSSEGCDSIISKPFKVYEQPTADMYIVPEIGSINNPQITFFSYTNSENWLWNFGDGTESNLPPPQTHTYQSTEAIYQVTLVVSNDFGCVDSITKTVIIVDDVLVFPNVITPNGDPFNQYFVIENAEKYPNNVLQVFNRWGKKVFEQQNYDNKWNGGNLADGTYFYIFKYIDKVYQGSLTILRQ